MYIQIQLVIFLGDALKVERRVSFELFFYFQHERTKIFQQTFSQIKSGTKRFAKTVSTDISHTTNKKTRKKLQQVLTLKSKVQEHHHQSYE